MVSTGLPTAINANYAASADVPPVAEFGNEPVWLLLAKVLAIFGFLVLMTLVTIVAERKIVARMQVRPGPNRVGPWGMLQSLADGLKLAFKEDIMPTLADRCVYFIAPALSCVPALLAFAVIPLGPRVSVFGHLTPLQLTDAPIAVLFMLACSSLGVYGIVLGGWASGSTYPLLGGLRSAAQMISYEISMGLSVVGVFLAAGTFSTSEIVAAQHDVWYFVLLAPSFLIYAISAVGETNRAPFDLPEAESELVGGFHTEYSSLKFALFFLAEYVNMVTVSALAVTLFFGGWQAPFGIAAAWAGANTGWWPVLWFVGKVFTCLFVFIWLRATLPRLRYDQFMRFGWKLLVPVSLGWILALSATKVLSAQYDVSSRWPQVALGATIVAAMLLGLAIRTRRTAVSRTQALVSHPDADYPVPPLDLRVPDPPRAEALAGPLAGAAQLQGRE